MNREITFDYKEGPVESSAFACIIVGGNSVKDCEIF